jgi:quinol-cytochrome oxidoreductase complex cytochrome b subunit
MVFQILSGLILTVYFFSGSAYVSVFYLSRETLVGELFRFVHGNGVSVIFLALYIHVFRGVGYMRYFLLPVWSSGLLMFILLILIAFLGYRLPWAQMSFWAATVITNLVTSLPVLGHQIVVVLWGNFSVSVLTLNRFYTLHFLLPFVLLVLIIVHILALHLIHTKSPLQLKGDFVSFFPLYMVKDLWLFRVLGVLLVVLAFFFPVFFMERDMFLEANPIRAPEHIVPE